MREKHTKTEESKEIFYWELEGYARERIREHLQDLLKQEVTEWFGQPRASGKSMRWSKLDTATGTASGGGSR